MLQAAPISDLLQVCFAADGVPVLRCALRGVPGAAKHTIGVQRKGGKTACLQARGLKHQRLQRAAPRHSQRKESPGTAGCGWMRPRRPPAQTGEMRRKEDRTEACHVPRLRYTMLQARGADVMQGYYLLEVSLAPTGAPALRCTTCCQCFEAFRSTG